jgi:hypothetical protein
MMSALNKYELRIENGTWNALSQKDERIIALQAQINSLAKPKETKTSKKKSKAKAKDGEVDDYAWKKVHPSNGETKKIVKGKTYHWCPKHSAWTIHAPDQCNLSSVPTPPTSKVSNDGPSLTLNTALQAVLDDESSTESQKE